MSDFDGLGPEGSYYEAKARREEEDHRRKMDSAYPLLITTLYAQFLGENVHFRKVLKFL